MSNIDQKVKENFADGVEGPIGATGPQGPIGASGFSNFITYEIPGTYTWTRPTGVTKVIVECWGAGGAGTFSNGSYYGGAGGGYGKSIIDVSNSSNVTVTVGPGTGGSSSFGNFLTATAGDFGENVGYSNGNILKLYGGRGGYGTTSTNVPSGAGALGGSGGYIFQNGFSPGGGGGLNANGGDGRVIIYW